MTADAPDAARDALAGHETFEATGAGDGTWTVDATAFEATVTVSADGADDGATRYEVAVRVPSLDAATADQVGDAVRSGWFETLRRRLADAPKATRAEVSLADFALRDAGPGDDDTAVGPDGAAADLVVAYTFKPETPAQGPPVAKTFVEYVEGTYVESVVPGYEYRGAVAGLLEAASQGEGTGTPL